jgi:aminoglycoside phosphotransferase
MNTALSFLHVHRERLGLDRYGVPAQWSSLVLTPRFRASRHVVFLIVPDGQPEPVLVAKVSRLAGASASLDREASALRSAQASRPGGFDSIPSVIAFEEYCGYPILVETAVVGRPMDPATVRRDREGCCNTVIDWLVDVQHPQNGRNGDNRFERFSDTLRYFADIFPLSAEESQALKQTWALVSPLRDAPLPRVFEHGDLSHPNLILRSAGGLGVVDWELAAPDGLPACDLFFFLTYVAFALHDAHSQEDYLSAFQDAFFGQEAWARSYVEAYAQRIQLSPDLLPPLFVFCWARYMSNLLVRLDGGGAVPGRVEPGTADWLRSNRYYALWRHTLRHIDELNLAR